jgi:type I restriction enzyme S subunit
MRARAALVEEAVGSGFDVGQFVENFEVLVEATGSAKLLRELVLQLAVTGRLSSARGESADPLLAKLRSERSKLAKAGVRIAEASGAVSDEEAPYPLPLGWRWTRLRDLGGFLGGGTPAKANEAFWNGPLPWVSPKDMKRPYIDDAEDHISIAAVEGSAVKLIPARSVLCVVRGMILAHSFPVAVTTREVTINQDMKALVLALPEISEFVLRSCQAARARVLAKVERSSHGTCRLESEAVEMLPIALPPLAEQKRIVAKVDQLMALCDELEARQTKKRETGARLTKSALEALTSAEGPEEFERAWTRVVENFEVVVDRAEKVGELRATILDLAVRGAITRSEAGDAAGSEFLAAQHGRNGRRQRGGPVESPEVQAAFAVRELWAWCSLGQLVHPDFPISYGVLVPGPEVAQGVPFVRIQDLSVSAPPSRPAKSIAAHIASQYSRTTLRGGEILLGVVGSIGKVGVAPATWAGAAIARAVCRIMSHPEVDGRYLAWAIQSRVLQDFFLESTRTLAQPTLNVGMIRAAPVPLPPLAEQQRIVAKVEQLMNVCDDLEAKLRRAEDRAARLVEAVVKEMVA